MSAIFFPLRTSVELFEDRQSPAAAARAKEAAILFDRLIFEAGLCDVTISEEGSWSTWLPPDYITPEHLEQSRKVIPASSPLQVVAQNTGQPRRAAGGRAARDPVGSGRRAVHERVPLRHPLGPRAVCAGVGGGARHPDLVAHEYRRRGGDPGG